ncbi:MAG: RagB/SusD family nutrient uptake outer membrane protein [Ferruginibacter sp.]
MNKSSKSSFTEDDVWNDINLVEKLVFAQYKGLGGFGTYNAISGDLLFTAASDETLFLFDYGMWVVNSGTIDASNMGAFAKDWRNKYSTIRNINMFLDRIDNVPNADPAKIARLKGEMKFMRAKAYADLINFFGGVPLITKVYGLNDDFTETRASYTECVNFIVKELDEAAALVPLTVSSADWGKITKGACLALKSEILLYAASKLHDPSSTPNGPLFEYNANDKWQQASDAAKAVIDMDQYSLIPADSWVDYTKIFLDVNPEIILARPYSSQYNHANIDKFNTPNGYHGYSGHVPTQRLVDDFEMDNGKMIDEQGSGYDANNPYKNRDPRFYADIVYQGANYRGRETDFSLPGGLDSRDGSESWNYSLTSYTMRKFMDESLDFNSGIGSQPYIFFRLAEIYLNYAEAQYNLGNEVVAREYVNKIRNRVKMPDISTSGQQLLKDIIRERRIELCFEDRRYYDVRRWMIADQTDNENATGVAWNKINGVLKSNPVTAQVRMFVPRMYYMPIPLSEIQKTGMEQNPGY